MATGGPNLKTELRCELCDCTLDSQHQLKVHLEGKRHQRHVKMQEQEAIDPSKLGIFVTGFNLPLVTESLVHFFQQFGKVIQYTRKPSYMIMDFERPEYAEMALSRPLYFQGRQLVVKRKKSVPIKATPSKVEGENPYTEVLDLLKSVDNFDEQVKILIENVQTNEETEDQLRIVFNDLRRAIQYSFPLCEVHAFGSTMTGLSYKKSDIDVFVENTELVRKDDVSFLHCAKRQLGNSRKFAHLIVVPHAKVPLLKCVHEQTGIRVDMNCRSMLGVCNSKLIKYYVNLHENFKPLFMVLKFWGKIHNLTGSNHLVTNYSLCMLIIFYLQHPPFSIPSVKHLQDSFPRKNTLVNGWKSDFSPLPYQNEALDKTSVKELMRGFFEFYKNFDFATNVICPYLGKTVPRSVFIDESTITEDFAIYRQNIAKSYLYSPIKIDTAICLQDPLELNRNTLFIITPITLELFVTFCTIGESILSENSEGLLYKVFTTAPLNHKSVSKIDDVAEFSITKPSSCPYLEKRIKGEGEKEKLLEEAWFNTVIEFLNIFFRDILYSKFEEIPDSPTAGKAKKVEGQTDVHDTSERKYYFNAAAPFNLWNSRIQTTKVMDFPSDISVVDRELQISQTMMRMYEGAKENTAKIHFKVTVYCKSNPSSVTIQLNKINAYKKSFKSMSQFVVTKFPNWFVRYENDLNNDRIR